ncbi:HAD-IA family hydrolase [Cryobacterium luteum]|uniref:Haloacid dehalogenase n=1 Tax=Cryobacterium luteum TaxID=1424661 RepID=A0A1H8KXA0_9MICO|nr:HAD-IA family hydrolase [Cryobacterium luteum]TFB84364.1 haloacid dehalogenase [Cryobacterium luteum]SEN97216.1 putative hydrolase of the HAD superfamily [Cryobacterium luteum]
MNLTDFDGLSFDVYGTLIDWEAGIAAVLGPWARRFDASWTDEQVLVAYSVHEAAVEAEKPGLLYPLVLAEAFRCTGVALGFVVGDEEATALGSSVAEWPAFADSVDALARLKKHYRLIVLSNVDDESFAASDGRLGHPFDLVFTAETVGSYKPNPRNFAVLLERVGVVGVGEGRLLHVAQSLFHDHVPARVAGLSSVWINRRHDVPGWGATPETTGEVSPAWEFTSMAAFADAVDAAWGSR